MFTPLILSLFSRIFRIIRVRNVCGKGINLGWGGAWDVYTYLIAILSEELYVFVIEIAHGDSLDFVAHLAVDARASRAHEHTKVHHYVGGALIENKRT